MEPALAIFAPLLGHCFVATLSPGVTNSAAPTLRFTRD